MCAPVVSQEIPGDVANCPLYTGRAGCRTKREEFGAPARSAGRLPEPELTEPAIILFKVSEEPGVPGEVIEQYRNRESREGRELLQKAYFRAGEFIETGQRQRG